jgi:UDP-glucose 4-epimerase
MAVLMATVLVLGAGQIGTFTAHELAAAGASVVVADARPAPRFFARFGPPATELARVDALDRAAVRRLVRRHRVDIVVFAAGLDAAASAVNPEAAWRVHSGGADAAAEAAVTGGATRFVLVSSFAVYGDPAIGPIPETAPLAPRSVYGHSKVAAEQVVRKASTRGLDVRIARPCGVYGPNRPGFGSRATRVIDGVLAAALARREGVLTTVRVATDEYLYVRDVARALSLIALDGGSSEAVFNLGAGMLTKPRALRTAVESVLPASGGVVESAKAGDAGVGFPLDIARARNVLGFRPRYNLELGLADYLATTGLA